MAIEKIKHYSLNNPASIYDEEALTALELAARTAKKANETVEDQNKLRIETEAKMREQDHRLTVMETVQIPETIVEEMDEKIEDGTFDGRISLYLNDLENRIDNMLGSMTEGSTTMDGEIIDARIDPTGKVHTNLGERIRDREQTVPFPKIAELYRADLLVDETRISPETVDMRYFTPGTIVFGNNLTTDDFTDLPPILRSSNLTPSYIVIEGFGEKQNNTWGDGTLQRFQPWIKQTLFCINGEQVMTWHRYLHFVDGHWTDTTLWVDGENAYDIYEGTAEEVQKMVDHSVEVRNTIVAVGGVEPIPGNGWILCVERASPGWIIQKAYGLHNNPKQFYRVGNNPSQHTNKAHWEKHGYSETYTDPDYIDWGEWTEVADMWTVNKMIDSVKQMINSLPSGGQSGSSLPWKDKTIVFLGDSICGNFRDDSGVCAIVEKLTGAFVWNFCFGGTRIHARSEENAYQIQDLSNLVTYIKNGGGLVDALEEQIIKDGGTQGGTYPQNYWREVAQGIDGFNFSSVDLFVIVSGTNDFYSYTDDPYEAFEKNDNAEGIAFVPQSLIHVCNTLKRIGKARVLYCAPLYRNDLEEDYISEKDYAEGVRDFGALGEYPLTNVVRDLTWACVLCCTPSVSPLEEIGINSDNWSYYGEDDVHLNADGRAVLGRYLAAEINKR